MTGTGVEWIVDAHGCDPEALRSPERLDALFAAIVRELDLHPVAPAVWHRFPDPGGITGVLVLSESHLTCHTFPERRYAALNLYCCRARASLPWDVRLSAALGATAVCVREITRGKQGRPPNDPS